MWGCVPVSERIRHAARVLLAGALLLGALPGAAAPARVVSINLCTDQLAMLLAAPGQLRSVSRMARDPRVSPMAEAAREYPVNSGRAEAVHAMAPDLVLADERSSRQTVALLRRLGIEVAEFAHVASLEDVRARILKMGRTLGREAVARAMVARFDADLARLREGRDGPPEGDAPRAALYSANGHSAGPGTLSADILAAAGLRNAPAEAGYGGGKLPLEVLAMLAPDIVVTARRYPGGSRAEAVMDHPVVTALRGQAAQTAISDQDWVCGTPFVLRAVADMAAARRRLEAGG